MIWKLGVVTSSFEVTVIKLTFGQLWCWFLRCEHYLFIQLFRYELLAKSLSHFATDAEDPHKTCRNNKAMITINLFTFWLGFITVMSLLPSLISHLSPVQGGRHEHEKVCFSLSGKQEPPLKQLLNKHPWLIKEMSKVKSTKLHENPADASGKLGMADLSHYFSQLHRPDSTFNRNNLLGLMLKAPYFCGRPCLAQTKLDYIILITFSRIEKVTPCSS